MSQVLTRRPDPAPDADGACPPVFLDFPIPVFVYGTLKAGFWNHRLLAGAVPGGNAISEGFYTLSDAGVPFAIPAPGNMPDPFSGYLVGEIYHVNAEILHRLDKLESNGFSYKRAPRPFRSLTTLAPITAWVYEYMHGHRAPMIPPDQNRLLIWRDRDGNDDDDADPS